MEIQEIAVQFNESTHNSQTIVLDTIRVRIDTYTNKADGCWYLDTFDGNGNPLVLGIAIVTGLDLWFPYHYLEGIPPGILFINDHVGDKEDPGLDSFDDQEAVMYYQTVT